MNYILKTILFLYFVQKCFLQNADENYYESEEDDEEKKPVGREGETTTTTRTPSSADTASDGITTTSDGITSKSDGITTTSDGITSKSDGITTKSDGITTTSDGITSKSDGITTPSNETTTTTPRPTTTEFKVGDEDSVKERFGYTDEQMSHLSDNAWANLESQNSKTDQYKRDNVFNANEQYWAGFFLNLEMMRESASFIYHVGSSYQQILTCYYISITIKNAKTDIRRYYKIRYLYVNNLEYEMGYLIEEIIVHYQIAVELYHFMYKKYGIARAKFYAPTTYMLYMYTNILNQCKVVIELCNMLHELEAKYKNQGKSIFHDEKIVIEQKEAKKHTDNAFQMDKHSQNAEEQKKNRLKDRQKALKKAQKMFALGGGVGGGPLKWQSPTNKPKKRYNFPLHYGWSIENW